MCTFLDSSGSGMVSGARRRTERLLSGRQALPAVLVEPGCLHGGAAALPHPGLRLPASVLPSTVPAVLSAVLPEPRLGLPAPVGPVPVHQLPPPAPAGRLALAEVALRGRGPTVSVSPGAEPGPPPGVRSRPAAPARPGGGGGGSGGRTPRDAPGTPRPGGAAGASFFLNITRYG